MAFVEDDLDLFLADFAVPVTANGTSGSGILDQNTEIILGGEVAMIDYILTVKTSEFGSLAYGDLITVNGATYKVETQPLRFDDGQFCRVPLVLTVAVANNITTLAGLRLVTLDGRYLVTLAS